MFDPLEEILRRALKRTRGTSSPLPREGCPLERELWDYLNGALEKGAEEKVSAHLAQCDFCLDSLLLAQEVRPGIAFGASEVSSAALDKAASLAKQGISSRAKRKRHLWLFLSLTLIGFSFFLPRYFLQCLILGGIFGLKWVFDTATNRTLIVMHEVLKKRAAETELPKEIEERAKKRE